ncbi:MAG: hypothetical protein AB1649_09835 [Chloroflexota bacterium]
MSKIDEYREKLKKLDDWLPYLKKNSGLPGPRGNLELVAAVAELASEEQIGEFLSTPIEKAPENTPEVFVVLCGVVSLGRLIVCGDKQQFRRLRMYASDLRWRIREATAIALQSVGDHDMQLLLKEMEKWIAGGWYEKRAVAAALAEPRLLKDQKVARQVLLLLDRITVEMEAAQSPGDEAFKVLRQAMGYCWSVAVAALPGEGKTVMEKWMSSQNKDIRWVMKENFKKNRLIKMDPDWVRDCQRQL